MKKGTGLTQHGTQIVVPENQLKDKLGRGGCASERVERAQMFINYNDIDFVPLARKLLVLLENGVEGAKDPELNWEDAVFLMLYPAMQLNAQGAMFQFPLISKICDVLVNFLEVMEVYNQDAIDIVMAHHDAVQHILDNNVRENGGELEKIMYNNLVAACNRYRKKYLH
ncbi:MAG: hypothetical protein EP349_02785 [Alphaproteobacteria bacterium]|nr:MAG: hypothetical protein EP349_02785 [Alphaproteobacteria bacterium]